MRDKQQASQEKCSNACTAIGRIIAFVVLAFAVCTLVKTFICGRVCEDCPCHGDGESSDCSSQEQTAEAA